MNPASKKRPTLRQEIAEALWDESLGLREISQAFHISEKDALGHLQHISRSNPRGRFILEPAQCTRCGFAFKKRTRLNTPSKCPLCKNEAISAPRFSIKIK